MKATFTSAGTTLPLWGVRAGMLVEQTRYDHEEQSLWCDLVDRRQIVGEIVRGLRETARLIPDPDRREEVEQGADNIAAIFGLTVPAWDAGSSTDASSRGTQRRSVETREGANPRE